MLLELGEAVALLAREIEKEHRISDMEQRFRHIRDGLLQCQYAMSKRDCSAADEKTVGDIERLTWDLLKRVAPDRWTLSSGA
jgi:hypothetical protein